jgi:hypothetical protein
LGNPITDCDRIRHCAVRVKKGHPDLATITGVHRARAVDDGDAVTCRQPAPRDNEAGKAVRQRDGHAGPDGRPLPRPQLDGLRRAQVGAGVARVGIPGHCLAGDEHFNGFCHESRVVQNDGGSRILSAAKV